MSVSYSPSPSSWVSDLEGDVPLLRRGCTTCRHLQRVEAAIDGSPIEEVILGRDGGYGGLILLRWTDQAPPTVGEVTWGFTTTDIGTRSPALVESAGANGARRAFRLGGGRGDEGRVCRRSRGASGRGRRGARGPPDRHHRLATTPASWADDCRLRPRSSRWSGAIVYVLISAWMKSSSWIGSDGSATSTPLARMSPISVSTTRSWVRSSVWSMTA